jgi:hypothetical protein
MPRFVYIDHSLIRVGGHEYDYALNVLRAAEASGYSVVLATNRRFRNHSGLPDRWPIFPLFPYTSHTRYCIAYGGHDHLPVGFDGRQLRSGGTAEQSPTLRQWLTRWTAAVGRLRRRMGARRRIQAWTRSIAQLFTAVELAEGDQVFLATFTEFDLLGLAQYLQDHPQSRRADWHVQFHFDLDEGCGPDDARHGERRAVARSQFQYSLGKLPHHSIYLYNTTAELAAQYNELGVAFFRHLPYPVSPKLQRRCGTRGGPLRVTCAGGIRREKGTRNLGKLVRTVRNDPFFDGKIQFSAQVQKEKLRQLGICEEASNGEQADIRVEGLPYPLEFDSYHDLIRQTDIGLFPYDRRRYHVRCSGILLEMFTAGKPVIVPAGCWLAEQVAEPVFAHADHLRRTLRLVQRLHAGDMNWEQVRGGDTMGAVAQPLVFTNSTEMATVLPVPSSATELVMAFRRLGQVQPGTYVSLQSAQFDRHGKLVDQFETVVGYRRAERPLLTLIRVEPRAVRIALRLRNAYHRGQLAVTDVEADFLHADRAGRCPLGRVGLIAARAEYMPRLLREMVENYAHYRASAEEFSREWLPSHDPARTVDVLTSNGTSAIHDAASKPDYPFAPVGSSYGNLGAVALPVQGRSTSLRWALARQ